MSSYEAVAANPVAAPHPAILRQGTYSLSHGCSGGDDIIYK